jgi:signal transduction histidine kinase
MAKVAANDDRPYEAYGLRADGTEYPVEVHPRTTPVALGSGVLRVVAMRDMTVRRALEEQLHQAGKLEAIGRVAAGVAHDFNNLLLVMTNAAELAGMHIADELPADHPARVELDEIVGASERAAKLVRQLLAFGRKTELQPRVVDAAEVVREMRSMLARIVGDVGELALALPEQPAWLRVDPIQLEQVIINLVVNARDAIASDGGRVELAVELVSLDDGFAQDHVGTEPGPHVELRVSDDGEGMDAETRQRVFEPFFTTKSSDHGTGLGLATVFGIIKQSGGTIWVESERGRGSSFTIYLPSVDVASRAALG